MSTFTLSVRRRDIALGAAFVLLLSAIWVAQSDLADAGGSPPGTGIAVVYVAVGTNYPDALGVGPGGGVNSAPIIILPTNPPIPTLSGAELVRLDPREVIIIGGTSAISDPMMAAIQALLPNATVSRLFGNDRYATNAAFSAATFPVEGWASVPGAAFSGSNVDIEDVNIAISGTNNTTTGDLFGAIQLPHGAEILELNISGFDNDVALDVTATLYRVNPAGSGESIAFVSTSGTPSVFTETTTEIELDTEIVDNGNYAYLIVLDGVDTDSGIHSVKVRYRLGASTG